MLGESVSLEVGEGSPRFFIEEAEGAAVFLFLAGVVGCFAVFLLCFLGVVFDFGFDLVGVAFFVALAGFFKDVVLPVNFDIFVAPASVEN